VVMTECCERGAALWNFIKLTEPEPEQLPKPETHNSLILVRRDDLFLDRRDKNVSLDVTSDDGRSQSDHPQSFLQEKK
jgi:hypothetical protein